jgi:hypothetical protein
MLTLRCDGTLGLKLQYQVSHLFYDSGYYAQGGVYDLSSPQHE